MTFNQPGSGASEFRLAHHVGRLVLFSVKEHVPVIKTAKYGDRDAIRADVVVLDGDGAPIVEQDVLLFQFPLIAGLKRSVGEMVLARIGREAYDPRDEGKQRPYWLDPFTDVDAKTAQAYLDSRPNPFQQPAAAPIDSAGPAPSWAPPVQQQAPQAPAPQAAAPVPAPQQVNTTTGEVTGGGQVAVKMQDGNVIMVDAATAQAIKNLPGATILG